MKTITHNLVAFAITTTVLAIAFRYSLTYGIESNSDFIVVFAALVYAGAMAFSGWTFGKRDWAYLPIYDVGFRFHATTFIVHNAVSELWFVFGLNSRFEDVSVIHWSALVWGLFLIGHFILFIRTRKNAINNLDKEDLFE